MAKVGFKIDVDPELMQALNKQKKFAGVKRVVAKSGANLQRETQRNMAATYTAGYSTGATLRSTKNTIKDNGLTAEVKPGTEYFAYLEYGTRFMDMRPTLKPAFDKVSKEFIQDLKGLR